MAWLHFWSICTFFNNEIFFKKFENFFRFLKIQRGDPVDSKKSKKNFKFFEKKFINKKCAYGPKMKPRQGFRQIFWCIWSGLPNNPRGEEKKGSFLEPLLLFNVTWNFSHFHVSTFRSKFCLKKFRTSLIETWFFA